VIISELERVLVDDLVDPLQIGRHSGIDARLVGKSAPFSPAHDAVQNPVVSFLTDQWPAGITLTYTECIGMQLNS